MNKEDLETIRNNPDVVRAVLKALEEGLEGSEKKLLQSDPNNVPHMVAARNELEGARNLISSLRRIVK